MREFSTAANRGRAAFKDADVIEFMLDDRVLTAHAPTAGQLALFMQDARGGPMRFVAALIDFFQHVLSDEDWAYVENLLAEGMDVDDLSDIYTYLLEDWSGRPTQRSSGSTPTRSGTGQRSTVKRQPKATTRSSSRSTASATSSSGGRASGSKSQKRS